MEIVPPAFTGDENAARCDESAFRIGFYMLNSAVAYDRLGFKNWFPVGCSFNGDYLIALAEEVRARRDERAGRMPKHRKEVIGEFAHRRVARWKPERMMQNM